MGVGVGLTLYAASLTLTLNLVALSPGACAVVSFSCARLTGAGASVCLHDCSSPCPTPHTWSYSSP